MIKIFGYVGDLLKWLVSTGWVKYVSTCVIFLVVTFYEKVSEFIQSLFIGSISFCFSLLNQLMPETQSIDLTAIYDSLSPNMKWIIHVTEVPFVISTLISALVFKTTKRFIPFIR